VIEEAQSVGIAGIGAILAASLLLSGSMYDVWFVRSRAKLRGSLRRQCRIVSEELVVADDSTTVTTMLRGDFVMGS